MTVGLNQRSSRRQFLKGVGALAALGAAGGGVGYEVWRSFFRGGAPAGSGRARAAAPTLDDFARNIAAGGPGKDGIPSIDHPKFMPASAARFLRDEDPVFGLVYRGEVRAYPQLILVWHEIVNDTVFGERLAVTYCPLTGSVVAFKGTARGRPLTFGTTGNLVNSNLLMYDRETDSNWPQLLGVAIRGPQKGKRLEEIPLVWATWGRWRRAWPATRVLSTDTGFARAYGQDPYGSYTPLGGYYASGGPFFPVMGQSRRLPTKEVVVGIKAPGARLAVPKKVIERERVVPLEVGKTPVVAVWDEKLATPRVFVPRVGRRELHFPRGQLRDQTTDSTWNPLGEAVAGPLAGARLALADFLDVMWFGWYAFYPQTTVIP